MVDVRPAIVFTCFENVDLVSTKSASLKSARPARSRKQTDPWLPGEALALVRFPIVQISGGSRVLSSINGLCRLGTVPSSMFSREFPASEPLSLSCCGSSPFESPVVLPCQLVVGDLRPGSAN